MESWDLTAIDAPDGTRDPVVLHSSPEARAVMIRLDAGQALGPHQVKERAWLCVVDGRATIEAGGQSVDGSPGAAAVVAADERRAERRGGGARVLRRRARWPGEGHYRGGDGPRADAAADA